jgi:hypothetical protein
VTAINITATAATITWTTNEAGDSQVEYGLTASYGSTSPLLPEMVMSHSLTLSGLSPNTVYHYRAVSRDASGNVTRSSDATFTTSSPGAISFVQQTGRVHAGGVGSLNASFATPPTAGNAVIVYAWSYNGDATLDFPANGVTDNRGNT